MNVSNGHIGSTLRKQKGQPLRTTGPDAPPDTTKQPGARMTIMTRPRGLRLPDTSHLAPEDAELFEALYLEHNYVSRGELQRVQVDRQRANERAA